MRAPKILAVASAVDLDFRYGCTPAWWQLWKGLYEAGCDLIVTPYRGRAVESPWWRVEPNPTYREGESFARVRDAAARLKGDLHLRRAEHNPDDTLADRVVREAIWRWVTPRWQRHLERILERERDVDAVVVFTVPMAHFRGIPEALRERFGVPVVFYDGDVPMSLPEFGGMDTGFNYYHGADPGEYDLVVSNSEGGLERLRELGARRAEAVFWGADPEFFAPQPVEKEMDVFFYGYGDKFRRDWMAAMVGEPSRGCPTPTSRSAAATSAATSAAPGSSATSRSTPSRRRSRAARINLCITRRSHATVDASSSCRPFELAASGAAIVSNPYDGIERWFEPGSRAARRRRAPTRRSPRTASCSPTRPPRRRWGGGRASASSTSTRTSTARGGCCRCSGSAVSSPSREAVAAAPVAADPRLQALRRVAIVPALNEERSVARVIAELRAFDPGLEIVVVSDGSTDRTAEVAEASGAHALRLPFNLGIGGAVQTGFLYAFEHDFDLAVRVDGDGQHDPSQLGAVLAPVLAGDADIAVGSRFAGSGRLPLVALAPARDPPPRPHRLGPRPPARHRHDLRLPGRQPRAGSRSSPRDYPHDYPEVEAVVMVHRHRLRLVEVPVSMREREHGRSSITALRSIYYMVKVLLALGVGVFRRNVVPVEEDVTPLKVSIAGAVASLLFLLVILELIREPPAARALRAALAASGVVLLALSLWRGGLNTIAGWVGIETYPPAVLFAVGVALHPRRAAALLDGDLAALRPEHDPRAAARAARGAAASADSPPPRAASRRVRTSRSCSGRRRRPAARAASDRRGRRPRPPGARDPDPVGVAAGSGESDELVAAVRADVGIAKRQPFAPSVTDGQPSPSPARGRRA